MTDPEAGRPDPDLPDSARPDPDRPDPDRPDSARPGGDPRDATQPDATQPAGTRHDPGHDPGQGSEDPGAGPAPDPLADLPPVDQITETTDLAPFLKPGIPAAIRNAALRRKWLLNPTIRDYVDPALDYAWDWNAATPVPGAGGRILVDNLAKMVRDVAKGPRIEQDAPAPPQSAEPATIPDADPPPPGDAAPACGHPPDDATRTAAGQGERPDPAPAPSVPVSRRRHGGAVPS